LTVFIFTADYGKTCRGRGHIVSPRAQLVVNNCICSYSGHDTVSVRNSANEDKAGSK